LLQGLEEDKTIETYTGKFMRSCVLELCRKFEVSACVSLLVLSHDSFTICLRRNPYTAIRGMSKCMRTILRKYEQMSV